MMLYFSQLEHVCRGKILRLHEDLTIEELVTDSRKALLNKQSIFIAIRGERHDGHQFINELYNRGIRQFIVEHNISLDNLPEANVMIVKSSIEALQKIATHHRNQFSIPVIAITGSNGKTIIKEWLFQLLSPDYKTVKNPGSYNSQLGVPLSVWHIQSHHEIGIFEAGISRKGEMKALCEIIQPTLGIFTNLGSAHDEGFASWKEKLQEKLKLFTYVERLVYCKDHELIDQAITNFSIPSLSWGFDRASDIQIIKNEKGYQVSWKSEIHLMRLPFDDPASVENCFHCIALLCYLGYDFQVIQERVNQLKVVPMRLELKQGINHCQIVDDSYNNDLGGLRIGLDFLRGIQKKKKTLILSDVLQSGLSDKELIQKITSAVSSSDVNRFIGIGPVLFKHHSELKSLPLVCDFYTDTQQFLSNADWNSFNQEVILIKGARTYGFEKIVARLQRKVHGTRMEIDLNKIIHNLNFFKSRLKPGVKIMVMVKAFAYGSGSEEIATLLQYHRVDFLGVAYADEGIELRKNQITIPVMVMNATEESFQSIIDQDLQPVMYSIKMLRAFANFLQGKSASVHLELETGMNRLGLESEDLKEVIAILKSNLNIRVVSIFSHLAGADEQLHDDYSKAQFNRYQNACNKICSELEIQPFKHILNSPGILRLPNYQLDMVRLGIGLYGINPITDSIDQLKPAATLKTVISQIKKVRKGETVGYGRRGKAETDLTLATIAIGYADGYSRIFSRGVGVVSVHGKRAPVVGNVCMDMTMIDITGIDATEGDEVIIFGDELPIHELAARANTIPYEILTNTSERVKRIFYAESM